MNERMPKVSRVTKISLIVIGSGIAFQLCAGLLPEASYITPPYRVSSAEAHQNCAKEVVRCDYFSFYGTVSGFKCLTDKDQQRIYFTEMSGRNLKRWYETKPKKEVSDEKFAEYCKSTFENYEQFMKETH